ncbi:hypothetical protein A2W14_07390 [Candidatus Gottesmanbacteria bacterium RBG_16_37_8]|uniref:Uncharacterized protein n=1 Tax=Candidatus Gottesmanbacteria bacterium RBG_16_37_8 TaxID=1798371 RepID=A0A1F5YR81_9BACT|nr:MAG: hypothetical protein A2W14_07390 [Candidatus Gottesmanbacteria bacterium RBG_16_37_8]
MLFRRIWLIIFSKTKAKKIAQASLFIFLVIPIILLIKNSRRIIILRNDFTAENLATDILDSVDKDSILIVSTDTPLFNTQYVYYSRKLWPDVKLIHFSKLYLPFYIKQLNLDYPDIEISSIIDTSDKFGRFLKENSKNFTIFTKQSFSLSSGRWLPWGLVYKYLAEDKKEDVAETVARNEQLWKSYHDPLQGSLSTYQNLYLTDVLRVYGIARLEIGNFLAEEEYYDLALPHLLLAKKLNPQDFDSYLLLAQIYMRQNKCSQAENEINQLLAKDSEDLTALYVKYQNYLNCYHDLSRASKVLEVVEKARKKTETPLEKL